jgi:hypothetical protein
MLSAFARVLYSTVQRKSRRLPQQPQSRSGSGRAQFPDLQRRGAAKEGVMYQQNYDPLGNVFPSTIAAAIPILTLLYFISLHQHRDAQGNVRLAIAAP